MKTVLGTGGVLLLVFIVMTVALVGGHTLMQATADANPGNAVLAHYADLTRTLAIVTLLCEAFGFLMTALVWAVFGRIDRAPYQRQVAHWAEERNETREQ